MLVRYGLTLGMILFIASEVMFFVAWFWAFFWGALYPADPQVYGRLDFTGGIWPPKGTEVINPLGLAADEHVRAADVELRGQRRA